MPDVFERGIRWIARGRVGGNLDGSRAAGADDARGAGVAVDPQLRRGGVLGRVSEVVDPQASLLAGIVRARVTGIHAERVEVGAERHLCVGHGVREIGDGTDRGGETARGGIPGQ